MCDACAIEANISAEVDSGVRRWYPDWKVGGSYLPNHPAWTLHAQLWDQFATECITVTDFEGMEVLSLCRKHLIEQAFTLG